MFFVFRIRSITFSIASPEEFEESDSIIVIILLRSHTCFRVSSSKSNSSRLVPLLYISNADGSELQEFYLPHDINSEFKDLVLFDSHIYIGLKNFEKAKQVLNMSITVNPNYARGYANLGIIHSDEENWDNAVSSLEMAVALNEKDSMSFFRLASAQNLKGDCQSAKDAARKSADLKSRFGGAWYELGIAEWCGGRGNKAGALNAFERARNDRDWRKMAEYEIDKVKNPQKYEK